jgi:hypothetical protein
VVNGTCECKDFPKAPSGWCKHRIAAGIQKRAAALAKATLAADTTGQAEPPTPPTQLDAPTAPLPEAPASVNVRVLIGGREVQWTLRDTDEARLAARLETLLQHYPVAATPTDTTPQCPTHGAMKPSTKGKGWYCPVKLADGAWCKAR